MERQKKDRGAKYSPFIRTIQKHAFCGGLGCARRVPAARPCFLVNAPTDLVKRAADGQTTPFSAAPGRVAQPQTTAKRRNKSLIFFFGFWVATYDFFQAKQEVTRSAAVGCCCRYCLLLLLIRLSSPQNTTPVRSLFSPPPPHQFNIACSPHVIREFSKPRTINRVIYISKTKKVQNHHALLNSTVDGLHDDAGDLVGIGIRSGTTVLEVAVALGGALAGDTDRCATVGDAVGEGFDGAGLVAASKTGLVALTVDEDVCERKKKATS